MRKTVLIVEDDPDNLETLSDLLIEEGYEVVTARSRREARDRLHRYQLCLVLADYLLPDGTGDEVVQLVRTYPEHRDVPVMILTAATASQMDNVDVPVLKKPISLEELLAAVRAQCGQPDDVRSSNEPALGADAPGR
jgi:DNA-binding response OmpR family regulator